MILNDDQVEIEGLKNTLSQFSSLEGKANFNKVEVPLNNWARQHEEGFNGDPELIGFVSRFTTYAIKLSMIIEVSTSGKLDISENSLHKATLVLDTLKGEYINLFKNDIALGRDAKQLRRLKEMIAAKGGQIDRRTLLQNSHMKARQFEEFLSTLQQTGEITVDDDKTAGRPKQIIKLIKP